VNKILTSLKICTIALNVPESHLKASLWCRLSQKKSY